VPPLWQTEKHHTFLTTTGDLTVGGGFISSAALRISAILFTTSVIPDV